jgi:large subunit ribosomal protein L21
MYAVIETGGKQYRVEVGTELEVELLDVEPGSDITLDRVLLVADGEEAAIGRPVVTDAVVSAQVLRQARGEKLIAFKYRPKARRRVKKGHRQELTVLRVTDVRLGARSAAEDVEAARAEEEAERDRLRELAARQAAADQELAARLAASTPAVDETAEEKPATPARRSRSSKATAEAATTESAAETEATDASAGAAEPATETEATDASDGTAEPAAETEATDASDATAAEPAAEAEATADTPASAKTEATADAADSTAPAADAEGGEGSAPTPKSTRAPRTRKES